MEKTLKTVKFCSSHDASNVIHCEEGSYLCISIRFRLAPLPLVQFTFSADGNKLRVQSSDADKFCYIILKTDIKNYVTHVK